VTPLVVLILALLWIAVLAPPLLRSRADGRPSASVSSFRRQLSSLQRTAPLSGVRINQPRSAVRIGQGAYHLGHTRAHAGQAFARSQSSAQRQAAARRAAQRRRRQNVLAALVGLALFTAAVGFGLQVRAAMFVHFVVDLALLGYIYLLVQIRRTEDEKAMRQMWSQAA
jgi:hypothetical protein